MSFFGFFGDSTDSIDKEKDAEIKRHEDAMASLNERKTKVLTASSNSGSWFGSWFGSSPSSTPTPTTTTTNQPNQTGGGKKKNKKSKTKKNVVRQQQQMISFSSGYTAK